MTGTTAHGDVVESELTQKELENIYYFLKRLFMGMLKEVKPKQVVYYIKNGKAPNARQFLRMIPKRIRRRLKNLSEKNQKLIDKYITAEQMIKYCEDELPELYKIFTTPKGRKWLETFAQYIQASIF